MDLGDAVESAVIAATTNCGSLASRNLLGALVAELIDEVQPTGPEQLEDIIKRANDMVADDSLAIDFERVVDGLPIREIIQSFTANRVPEIGDPCYVEEGEAWLRGYIEGIVDDSYVCVLDNFTGEYLKSREQISCDWEIDEHSQGDDESGTCPMCHREDILLTRHHLRPRQLHSQLMKKGLSRELLNECALICRPCHSAVHRAKSNAELAKEFYTLESIATIPQIQTWVRWAGKQRVRAKRRR